MTELKQLILRNLVFGKSLVLNPTSSVKPLIIVLVLNRLIKTKVECCPTSGTSHTAINFLLIFFREPAVFKTSGMTRHSAGIVPDIEI